MYEKLNDICLNEHYAKECNDYRECQICRHCLGTMGSKSLRCELVRGAPCWVALFYSDACQFEEDGERASSLLPEEA